MQTASNDHRTTLSPTSVLAKFASGLRFNHIDSASLNTARRHTLDTIGAIYAGSTQHATLAAAKAFDKLAITGSVPVPGFKNTMTLCQLLIFRGLLLMVWSSMMVIVLDRFIQDAL